MDERQGIERQRSSEDTHGSTVELLLQGTLSGLTRAQRREQQQRTQVVTLTGRVTDTTHPEGLTDTLDVTVRVTNVDEDGFG